MGYQKKILAFAMLLLVAAPLFLFTAYLIKQKIIQHQMEEQLENTALQTILVNKADVKWTSENKEAIIDGQLFDVKFSTISNGKLLLTGLYDAAENKLQIQFAGLLRQQKDKSTPLEKLMLKYISAVAIVENLAFVNCFYNNLKLEYHNYNQVCIVNSQVVFTPPPNILL